MSNDYIGMDRGQLYECIQDLEAENKQLREALEGILLTENLNDIHNIAVAAKGV